MAGIGSYDAEGWTDLVPTTGSGDPSDDSKMIYVSSSIGSDSYNGLSGTVDGGGVGPKLTIQAGYALLRDGYPDWLQLKRGDLWNEEDLEIGAAGTLSGLSASEPIVITAYGTGARPLIKNGAFVCNGGSVISKMAITSLEFYGSYLDPAGDAGTPRTTGIFFLYSTGSNCQNILIEDCRVRWNAGLGVYMQAASAQRYSNFYFRRNVIEETETGLSCPYGQTVLIEDNIFVRNGWEPRDVFIHSIYAKEVKNLTARGNLLAYSGNHGIKLSADAVDGYTDFDIDDNFFWYSVLGLDWSAGAIGDYTTTVTHRGGTITDNVFSEMDKNPGYNQSIATYILNLADCTFDRNLFVHHTSTNHTGVVLGFGSGTLHENITITNNIIWDWYSYSYINNGEYLVIYEDIVDLTVSGNIAEEVDSFVFPSTDTFSDTTRSIQTYNSEVLGGTEDADELLANAVLMRKGAWDERYTASAINTWIRAGFDILDHNPTTFGGDTSGECDENADYVTGILTASDAVDGMTTPNFTVTVEATNGEGSINPTTGAWSYTPEPDFFGSDSFTVRVTDDLGNHDTQVITITVNEVDGSTKYVISAGGITYVFQTGGE